jgi:shikimate kinase
MNLVLIGFMASGKTSVGRRVARRLGYRFLDTDHFIETELGCTIANLFETKGEPHFRLLETRLSRRLSALTNTVISTGGGMPAIPGNFDTLRKAGVVVFLNADVGEILQRLERDTRRPKVQGGELREKVLKLHGERLPVYSQADVIVDTKAKSVNRVAGDVIRLAVEAMHAREAAAARLAVTASSPASATTAPEAAPPIPAEPEPQSA